MIDISGIKDGDIHLVKQKCSGNKEQENRNKTNKNNCLFEESHVMCIKISVYILLFGVPACWIPTCQIPACWIPAC